MRSYYDILNVSVDAEDFVVRAAYRAMMGRYHPDASKSDPALAEQMAKLINEAYATLRIPARRAAYDKWLRSQKSSGHASGDGQQEQPDPVSPEERPRYAAAGTVKAVYATRTQTEERGLKQLWLVLFLPALTVLATGQWSETSTLLPEGAPVALEDQAPQPAAGWRDDLGGFKENAGSDAEPIAPPTAINLEEQADEMEAESEAVDSTPASAELFSQSDEAIANIATARGGNSRPDFSGISSEDRSTIEIACSGKFGVVAKNGCLREEAGQLTAENRRPDLSNISSDDRSTIEIACSGKFGIVAKNQCLRAELTSLTGQ